MNQPDHDATDSESTIPSPNRTSLPVSASLSMKTKIHGHFLIFDLRRFKFKFIISHHELAIDLASAENNSCWLKQGVRVCVQPQDVRQHMANLYRAASHFGTKVVGKPPYRTWCAAYRGTLGKAFHRDKVNNTLRIVICIGSKGQPRLMGVRDASTHHVLYHTVPSCYAYIMSAEGCGVLPFSDGSFVQHSVLATPGDATSLSVIMDFYVQAKDQAQMLKGIMTDPDNAGLASPVDFHENSDLDATFRVTDGGIPTASQRSNSTPNDNDDRMFDIIKSIPFDVPYGSSR